MAWLSRILAPVDFLPRDHGAAQYAETLASHFHSKLMLLHIIPPALGVFTSPEAAAYLIAIDRTEERLEEGKAALAAYLAGEPPDVQLSEDVLAGDPARTIVEFAREHEADLIVMATHGRGPIGRFFLGSVTAHVLRDAACPVFTGAHLESAPDYRQIHFQRILCALDLGRSSCAVLQWAAAFAKEFDAELTIAHVLPRSVVEVGGIYFDPVWRQEAIAEARAEIQCLQQEADAPGEVRIEIGETSLTIGEIAATSGADLLVIGRGSEAGLVSRLGASAFSILRESPCPVTTV